MDCITVILNIALLNNSVMVSGDYGVIVVRSLKGVDFLVELPLATD